MSRNIKYLETEYKIIKNNETGEIQEQETKKVQTVKVEQEPNFIKLYLDDLCRLRELPKTTNKILNELLKYTNYENIILLPSGVKQNIVENIGTSRGVLDNTLTRLVKEEILKRDGIGVYRLNPNLFGKGKWVDIKELRVNWTYNKNGKSMEVEISK